MPPGGSQVNVDVAASVTIVSDVPVAAETDALATGAEGSGSSGAVEQPATAIPATASATMRRPIRDITSAP